MTAPTPPDDRYIGGTELELLLGDAPFKVMVHIGILDGRASCVGLDVRAFDETRGADGSFTVDPLNEWRPLTARRLRQLRLDAVASEGMATFRASIEQAIVGTDPKDWGEFVRQAMADMATLRDTAGPRRPGRPAALSDHDVVAVVVKAYNEHLKNGGKAPVIAVQQALEESNSLPGASKDGEVTIGQARAAVRRARQLGLLTNSLGTEEER